MIENQFSLWFNGKTKKIVTAASTVFGKNPIRKSNCYIKEKGGRVEINQPSEIAIYKKAIGGVNRMDEDISVYMINIRNKKCW